LALRDSKSVTRVVAAVMARSTAEMLRAAEEATEGADLVELRADALRNPDLEKLRGAGSKPLIFTCRSPREGGVFQGSEADRRAILRRALELGFDFVDIELDTLSDDLRSVATSSRLILSHHAFEGLPEDLPGLVERAARGGADIVKLAARARSLADVLKLGEVGRVVRQRGLGFAPITMGPAGTAGRVLASRFGAELTYAAARGMPATGPGQLDLDELLNLYRFRSIDGLTRIYGILGRPVRDSLSPAMHNDFFRRRGLNAVYLPFEEEELPAFVSAAKDLGVAGLSVTRPFKESIISFLDEVDGKALEVGAVNTVAVREGKWWGFNTDTEGVVRPVSRRMDPAGKLAVILGAGGAARAAAVGLRQAGAQVVVLARRAESARAVAQAGGGQAGSLDEIGQRRWDILVNATPLSQGLLDAREALDSFRPGALVLDMVYQPEQTELLETARRRGAMAVSGLEMLVAQAVGQDEIWTGGKADTEAMELAARAELARRAGKSWNPFGLERYSRQVLFQGIGESGQLKIRGSRVLVVGAGAVGSVSSEMLVRAGVGSLRLVDRDHLDPSNLQRQGLYDQEDLAQNLPKAVAAARKLRRINDEVTVEGAVVDLGPDNVEELLDGIDLALDGTDNFETRYVLNDACVKTGTPWIYAACVGSYGMTYVIRPGETACLRCLLEVEPPPGASPTCDTAGVIAPIVHAVAAFQVSEALKLLAGKETDLLNKVLSMDAWTGQFSKASMAERRADCPACGARRFDYLAAGSRTGAAILCGRNAVQVRPTAKVPVKLEELAARLRALGEVRANDYLVRFQAEGKELVVFVDGRAIIHGTEDLAQAKSLYSRYVGL